MRIGYGRWAQVELRRECGREGEVGRVYGVVCTPSGLSSGGLSAPPPV